VRVYLNGSGSFSTILTISTLDPGDVFVLCSRSITAGCDLINATTMTQVDGNDAIELVCTDDDTVVTQDVIDQILNNPTSDEWGTNLTSTADNTIRRSCDVTIGDRNGYDFFSPSPLQWTGFVANTSSDLGFRFCPIK
jgi:hypothetical protein